MLDEAQGLLDCGWAKADVAEELQIHVDTLRRAVWDGRLDKPGEVTSSTASVKSERSVEDAKAAEGMGTACVRVVERVSAALGLLVDGTKTHFDSSKDVVCGGVLCAFPALLANGLFCGVQECLGKIKGYYNSSHILLLLAYMSLCRITTVEQLRGKSPGQLGRLLGLDRIPEVRCLREKMKQLSENECAEKWAAHLSKEWLSDHNDVLGALYVDGHVRVYHGAKNKIPKKYVSRQRLCLRGTTDYWVNDSQGQPFFVIDKVVDPGLIQTLSEDIVPRLLKDIPKQPTQEQLENDPYLCRFILVFDREGYSPAFFSKIWEDHRIGCITYHKHALGDWDEKEFTEKWVCLSNGKKVCMKLAERGSLIGSGKKALWMKEVRKLNPSGHQTSLIATAYGLEPGDLAVGLFSRWCQENFFKYMIKHYGIDTLSECHSEPLHDTKKVVNPAWREFNREQNSLKNKLRYRQCRFAHFTLHPIAESEIKKYEKWVRKKAQLLEEIQELERQLEQIKSSMKQTDKHISWEDLEEKDRFEKPTIARKRLVDTIRMIAYRSETSMAHLLTEQQIRLSDARRILQDLFTTEADIEPDIDTQQLKIKIHRSSRPVVDRNLENLLVGLNETQTKYPGTDLILKYELVGQDQVSHQNSVTSVSQR